MFSRGGCDVKHRTATLDQPHSLQQREQNVCRTRLNLECATQGWEVGGIAIQNRKEIQPDQRRGQEIGRVEGISRAVELKGVRLGTGQQRLKILRIHVASRTSLPFAWEEIRASESGSHTQKEWLQPGADRSRPIADSGSKAAMVQPTLARFFSLDSVLEFRSTDSVGCAPSLSSKRP